MRPLFTVHAGEYLVGSHIEQNYKKVIVWIPSLDTGVDLMLSDPKGRSTVSIQVKFSKDFLPDMKPEFRDPLRVCSYFTINRHKRSPSQADFWVFVLRGFKSHSNDFVIVPTGELRWRLSRIHKSKAKIIHSYLWVTESKRCWEARGLKVADRRKIAKDLYKDRFRDFTKWLNDWSPVLKKLRA